MPAIPMRPPAACTLAWMLWWIAFVPGVLLLAVGARRGIGFSLACLLAGLLVPLLAVFAPVGSWVGLAQRLAFRDLVRLVAGR